MPKGFLITFALFVTAVETAVGDTDLVRYGVTQGGLLAVVLVLIWSYRKDMLGALRVERANVATLTELVATTRVAIEKSAEAISSQARSIDNLSRAVERIEERRSSR